MKPLVVRRFILNLTNILRNPGHHDEMNGMYKKKENNCIKELHKTNEKSDPDIKFIVKLVQLNHESIIFNKVSFTGVDQSQTVFKQKWRFNSLPRAGLNR